VSVADTYPMTSASQIYVVAACVTPVSCETLRPVSDRCGDVKGSTAVECLFCGGGVDTEDPEVFSLVARWDDGYEPALEDAIHRRCLHCATQHSSLFPG